jgi:hypothetical protein
MIRWLLADRVGFRDRLEQNMSSSALTVAMEVRNSRNPRFRR